MPNINLVRKPATDTTSGEGSFRDVFPAGVVLPFAGAAAPDGWLLCDGSAISRTTYARLFATIGTSFGVGDGSTTFNLPNTQGVFIRGAGSQTISAINYSGTLGAKANDATKKNGLEVSGGTASLTGTTSFASTSHTHRQTSNFTAGFFNGAGYKYTGGGESVVGNSFVSTSTPLGGTPSGTVSISSTPASINNGDAETCPANLGMNHIIKV
jgi:microcystin-dependent protein